MWEAGDPLGHKAIRLRWLFLLKYYVLQTASGVEVRSHGMAWHDMAWHGMATARCILCN